MDEKCTIYEIVNGSQKNYVLYEDDLFISFLDSHPLFLGHALLAPKKHWKTIYNLPNHQGNDFLKNIQRIGRAVMQAMDAQGTFIANNAIVSQSIFHLHVHIVPRKEGDGLKGFFWPRTKYQPV